MKSQFQGRQVRGLRAGFMVGCCAAALTAVPAAAQDTAAAGQPNANLEEIVVTGTRLGTSAINAQTPVQVITAEQFAARGETSAADALEQIPALQFSLSTEQTLRDGATGRPTLNLRSLGAARTLVLVNGRRHVSGEAGTASVDISSIPSALIERVDVLTGGASAIYGSDAVTGVVNFIMKKDFEGQQVDLQWETSDEGDANVGFASYVGGVNFDNGKGNVTLGLQIEDRKGLRNFDRPFSDNNGVPLIAGNPALRFQAGDPLPPGRTASQVLGRTILRGTTPRFAGTDASLISRAQAAKPRAYGKDFRFAISSTSALIGLDPVGNLYAAGPGEFRALLDTNGNGIEDCRDSAIGAGVAGFTPGCWVLDDVTGALRPFRDGVFADGIRQFGGDGAEQSTDGDSLTPETNNVSVNLNLTYEVTPLFKPYAELKFSRNRTREYAFYNTFDDTLTVGLDNPFIPTALRALANQEIAARRAANPAYNARDFLITIARDHTDIFDPQINYNRETYRAVLGTEGEFSNGWNYDLSYNYGRTEQETSSAQRLRDRFFAAADATVDAQGRPACRIAVNGTLPIASFLDPDAFSPVPAVSYNPAECVPLNLFGRNRNTQQALAFQRFIGVDTTTLEQSVVQGILTGDSADLFSLPAGPIEFAVGAEYRDEKSDFLPNIVDRNGNSFEQRTVAAVEGSFDVKEAFTEVSIPLLADMPFAKMVNINGAVRIGDYSTIGTVTSYKTDAIYQPIDDVRIRGGYSRTIRAPNITELFLPGQSVNSNPTDVCLQENINLGPRPADRLRNCSAQFGRDLTVTPHTNQRTAQFAGVRGGNPNLTEETSDTYSAGIVLTPTFLDGFTATVDYWNIKIDDAIQAVAQNDIVASCYDATDLNNPFCGLFSRNLTGTVATNPQFGWINSIRQTDINFAGLEAAGIDFDVSYRFDLETLATTSDYGALTFRVAGTWLGKRKDFPFPAEPDRANPELSEFDRPKWSGTGSITWDVGDLSLGWYATYQGKQLLRGVEMENQDVANPWVGDAWVHDVSVTYDLSEKLRIIGGVNNVFEREPYFSETSSPASAVGRSVFIRFSAKL